MTPDRTRLAIQARNGAIVELLEAAPYSGADILARCWLAATMWNLGLYPVEPDDVDYDRLEAAGIALRPRPAKQDDNLEPDDDELLELEALTA